MTGRRIVSIWLPRFAIARWQRAMAAMPVSSVPWDEPEPELAPDAPVLLAAEGPHGPVIHAVSEAAAALGAARGDRVVDAQALSPDLIVRPADLAGDADALTRLAHWSRRWCPWSATDGADGLVLDTTGSAHLWGGEAAMLADMQAKLAGLGQEARIALAPTHGAAWALARYGDPRPICDDPEAALQGLPIAALRLDAETKLTLRRLGLKRIGDLMDVPRVSLGRRLSPALNRLDQALGELPEPIVAPPPPHRYRALRRLAEPILDPQPYLPELLGDLCRQLEATGHGLRALTLELYRTDGTAARFAVATAKAVRDPRHLQRLLEKRFESLDAGFGFDILAAEAGRAEPLAPAQTRLDGEADADLAFASLVDRLSARLGRRAVQVPVPRESHIPERAEAWLPALDHMQGRRADLLAPGGLGGGGMIAPKRERPIRLLSAPERIEVLYAIPEGPPVRFKWRRRPYRIARHQGPERLAPEWWHDRATARLRDYYKVEVTDGGRYWLFREGVLGDGRGGTPDWFLHGLFA
ncbi:MAG: DNA polymerase Y family protein [Pseudomonadota bacterium]